jgi:hypothetical protein
MTVGGFRVQHRRESLAKAARAAKAKVARIKEKQREARRKHNAKGENSGAKQKQQQGEDNEEDEERGKTDEGALEIEVDAELMLRDVFARVCLAVSLRTGLDLPSALGLRGHPLCAGIHPAGGPSKPGCQRDKIPESAKSRGAVGVGGGRRGGGGGCDAREEVPVEVVLEVRVGRVESATEYAARVAAQHRER